MRIPFSFKIRRWESFNLTICLIERLFVIYYITLLDASRILKLRYLKEKRFAEGL